jgi:polar amino acid transport system substrate-binding protein
LGLLLIGGTWWVYKNGLILNNTNNFRKNAEVLRIKKNGVLRVGCDATYFPIEYLDEKGKIVGFGPDLAAEVAKAFGVPLEMKNIAWEKVFTELDEGKIDMIISSVTITTERKKVMSFSKPYFSSGQVVVINKSDNNIKNLSDLVNKKIGVQSDTTSEGEAIKLAGESNVVKYPEFNSAINDLIAGKINAVIMDYPPALGKVKNNQSLKLVGGPFTQEFWGVVVAKDNDELLIPVNGVIERMVDTGEIKKLEDKWLK